MTNKKVAIVITPNYKDYAEKYLADCIDSICKQDYQGEIKVFITDNETSPESFKLLNEILTTRNTPLAPSQEGILTPRAPEIPPTLPNQVEDKLFIKGGNLEFEIILNKNNDGFAKGVNDSIRRALAQGFDYIAVVNIHTTVEANYISELVKVMESRNIRFNTPPTPSQEGTSTGEIGVVQGRMMIDPEKDKISSLGNITHFLGFGYCSHYREEWNKIKSQFPIPNSQFPIHYPSGSSMFFKKEVLEHVGLLDEEYWMYNEDQEIGWRIWLAGYRCVLAPNAVMYNKYEFARSIKKYYWMDRNRINAILQCYKLPTLFLILPAFVIMELGLILFSLKTGWFKEKMQVWKYFFTPAKWKYIYKARKRNQSLRRVKDKEIVKMISGRIWYQEVGDWKLRLINPIFELYWKIVKLFIVW